jgi:hypothetical protein
MKAGGSDVVGSWLEGEKRFEDEGTERSEAK